MASFAFIVSIFYPHNHYGVIGIIVSISGPVVSIKLSSDDNVQGLDGIIRFHCHHILSS